ncbi:MAG: aminotransferase class V-fold PLP-dependent enzyme [Cyclobacteriaceae bacterium]
MHNEDLQERMFLEMRNKQLMDQAQQYAYQHLETVLDRNVYPTEEALSNLAIFEESLPDAATAPEKVIDQLYQHGSPATVATLGGRYFGFVTGSALPVGLAAKHLGTYWDQASALHVLSPICAKLEAVVEKWLIQLFHLPENTAAGFVSGSSTANLCALAAARYRILERQGWDINAQGLFNAPRIRIVTGKHAHSSILKAISILGFGQDHIEWVAVDDQGRIMPEDMPALDEKTILILQAGNVSSGAFDDFNTLCDAANKAGAWVHIDGAFGLWAEAVASLKHLTAGMGKASSWAVDGHKTLNTPYDCGIVLCADQAALAAALHMSGSYIIESKERDGMFYTPEMSRRSRIIELWAILKYLGKSGIDQMVYAMHERARQFAWEISRRDGFYVDNEVVFNQVLVRCDDDETTEQVLKNVQELRECWAGGAQWFGKRVIRVSVCSWATTAPDITRSVVSFEKALSMIPNTPSNH